MLTSEVRPAEARFELTLAFHCAPALAGIKPADLIALPGEGDETDALLASYSAALAGAGISLRPLCRCRSRCIPTAAVRVNGHGPKDAPGAGGVRKTALPLTERTEKQSARPRLTRERA